MWKMFPVTATACPPPLTFLVRTFSLASSHWASYTSGGRKLSKGCKSKASAKALVSTCATQASRAASPEQGVAETLRPRMGRPGPTSLVATMKPTRRRLVLWLPALPPAILTRPPPADSCPSSVPCATKTMLRSSWVRQYDDEEGVPRGADFLCLAIMLDHEYLALTPCLSPTCPATTRVRANASSGREDSGSFARAGNL